MFPTCVVEKAMKRNFTYITFNITLIDDGTPNIYPLFSFTVDLWRFLISFQCNMLCLCVCLRISLDVFQYCYVFLDGGSYLRPQLCNIYFIFMRVVNYWIHSWMYATITRCKTIQILFKIISITCGENSSLNALKLLCNIFLLSSVYYKYYTIVFFTMLTL